MARTYYGGSPADVMAKVTADDGDLAPSQDPLNAYDAETGGTHFTSLLDVNLNPITVVTPDAIGRVRFWGPDGYDGPIWLEDALGNRWRIDPADIANRVGKSAYELAVEGGFVGTLEEWQLSLKGADGAPGDPGADGADGADGINGLDGADGANGVSMEAYTIPAPLGTGTGARLFTNRAPTTRNILAVEVIPSAVATAGSTVIDVNVQGTTIFTTQARRPTLATGASSALSGVVENGAINPGQTATLDIDSIGTFPGGTTLRVEVTVQ